MAFPFTACEKEPEVISGNAIFHLSSEELKMKMDSAEKGDAEAAYKIANYYNFSKNDQITGLSWLKKAADLGHQLAKKEYETQRRIMGIKE